MFTIHTFIILGTKDIASAMFLGISEDFCYDIVVVFSVFWCSDSSWIAAGASWSAGGTGEQRGGGG